MEIEGKGSMSDKEFVQWTSREEENFQHVLDNMNELPSKDDKWNLVPEFVRTRGLIKQQIHSFNFFIQVQMKKIMKANQEIRSEVNPKFWFRFIDIYVDMPRYQEDVHVVNDKITPNECRNRGLTYSAPIYVDIQYTLGEKVVTKKGITIGQLPIMLQSCRCILRNKSPEEITKMKECLYDPGGYFVIRGAEKVLLMQEQLSKNRVLIEQNEDGGIMANVTSTTTERRSRCYVVARKGRLYLKHNAFAVEIPICIVFKALGVESDQEIVAMVCNEPNMLTYFNLSLEESHNEKIYTQLQALKWMGTQVRLRQSKWTKKRPPEEEAREVLATLVLGHVPVLQYNFWDKAVYLAYMTRLVLLGTFDNTILSDKDYYGNKRIETSGDLIGILFEDLFKTFIMKAREHINKYFQQAKPANPLLMETVLPQYQEILTTGFVTAIKSGNWNLKRFKMERKGVAEPVTRLSYIAAIGHMTRIRSHIEKAQNVSGPRALQPSQFGMVCPSDTPEGEQCGLVKSLTLLAYITQDDDEALLRQVVFDLGVLDISQIGAEEVYAPPSYLVILDGNIIGIHRSPSRLVNEIRFLRRRGLVGAFVSVYMDQMHIQMVREGRMTINDLVKQGYIEYIDVNEENSCLICVTNEQITEYTTHMEIDPVSLLGIVASLIPYPHHNQSPRNTYQCAMGKQAMGTLAMNQYVRTDISPLNTLVYPQMPMVRSRALDLFHFNSIPAGQNATVAVMSYSGYDIEDAIVLNKASVDRGYGRVVVYKKFVNNLKTYLNKTSDRIANTPRREDQKIKMSDQSWNRKISAYKALGPDGLADPGKKIEQGNILVNKEIPSNTSDMGVIADNYIPCPMKYKEWGGYIDKVLLTTSDSERFSIKIMVRDMRRPELGDKFSSRHGQKGVVGMIVPQVDMPFSERGICPDMIMNPHGFPSRMTVGKMIELIAGKCGVHEGDRKYGTVFGGTTLASTAEALLKNGFSYNGKDFLYSGITGDPIKTYIFMGPIYYQRLKHMVKDKVFARAKGPRVALTHQPTQGRARDGGLRVGEMEKDCLVAHGTSMLLIERLLLSSDPFLASICTKCGLLAQKDWCQYCKTGSYINLVRIPYACKLLFQELQSMNVIPKITLGEGGYFDYNFYKDGSGSV
ncbi:hypothetical protein WA158_007564 [Blastocystis sp. Blastoise]